MTSQCINDVLNLWSSIGKSGAQLGDAHDGILLGDQGHMLVDVTLKRSLKRDNSEIKSVIALRNGLGFSEPFESSKS